MHKITFTKALVSGQWHDDVTVTIDGQGVIAAIAVNCPAQGEGGAEVVNGFALPGMPNVHSHAFQRAMAGLAEYATSQKDSFWTWRDVMYRFAQKLTPEDLYDIARQLYLEMVTAGYTSVAEFHYLHHQPGGKAYDNRAEMSLVLIEAAKDVGLNLTLLPVLYTSSGFGGLPLNEAQARFGHSVDNFCLLLDQLHKSFKGSSAQTLGVAFHSLRAVPPLALNQVVAHMNSLDASAPLHIHIAEQVKEVEECLQWSAKRPVEWLLDAQDLTERWCLVHATHMTSSETVALAKSGTVVGICPTTEANLGDGFFPLKLFLAEGGNISIGSDSHVSISPVEEFRLLEYGQRLKYQSRNTVATAEQPHTGKGLYLNALKGGALAIGQNTGSIEVGKQADLIVLDPDSPLLVGTPDKYLLDRFIFSGNQSPVKSVMCAGNWRVKDWRHPKAEDIVNKFRGTMKKLEAALN